jgi:hypothetical protein
MPQAETKPLGKPVYPMVYVWDDKGHRVVDVRYGALAGQPVPEGRFAGSYDPAKAEAAVRELEAKYGASRYTVADWSATSLRTFYMSRYGWTDEEYQLFSEGKLAPEPVREEASDQPEQEGITGIEIEVGVIGQHSGLPAAEEKLKAALFGALEEGTSLLLEEMRVQGLDPADPGRLADFKRERREKGLKNFDLIGDIPICWGRLTADTGKKLMWYLRQFLQDNAGKVERLWVPSIWAEALEDLKALLPGGKVSMNPDPDHPLFMLELKEPDNGTRTEWILGTRDALKMHAAYMVDVPAGLDLPGSLDGKLTLVQSRKLLRTIEERLGRRKDAP